MTGPRHVFAEHTGELEVRIEAPTLAALFAEAGRALMEAMSGAAPLPAAAGPSEIVELRAADREALLVDWLNELICRVETGRRLYREIAVDAADERELSAAIRGAAAPELRTLVKAASFHGLHVAQAPGGWAATVVLDV